MKLFVTGGSASGKSEYAGKAAEALSGGLPVLYVVMATLVAALIGATVIIKHRANIKRIRNGTESTISFKKK